jgi:hypothetical protein
MQGARGQWKVSSLLYPGGKKQILTGKISAAQILLLNSVGLLGFIPAPGTGLAVLLDQLTIRFIFGTVQYTGGGAISAQYHTTSTNILAATLAAASIQAAANGTWRFEPANTAGGIVVPSNQGIDLVAATGDFAAGDGTAKFYAETTIIKL